MTKSYDWLETDSPERRAWLSVQAEQTDAHFAARFPYAARHIPQAIPASTEMPLESSLSPDGGWLAYAVATTGRELQHWRVRSMAESACDERSRTVASTAAKAGQAQLRLDEVQQVYASGIVWDIDSQGFFYNRFWEWPGYHALYYHHLGTQQAADRLLYQQPEQQDWYYLPQPTIDGRYVVITILRKNDWRNRVLIHDRQQPDSSPLVLIPDFTGRYDFVMNQGQRFWLRAEDAAYPNGRVVVVELQDEANSTGAKLQAIIPPNEWRLQRVIRLAEQRLALLYLEAACARIKIVNIAGQHLAALPLLGHGTVEAVALKDNQLTYSYTDFVTPLTDYRYQLDPQTTDIILNPDSVPTALSHNPADYETQQVWYPSKDGTLISMFLTYKRTTESTLAQTGQQPIYLYGYGGFGASLTPHYTAWVMDWLDLGGVYAVANLRGGGEYGVAWHQAAVGRHKQTTFDDCLAAAEWLIAQKYTCPARLALGGQSNGGLTAAACLTQRPDLFRAVIIEAGLMDMLRFDQLGHGQDWVTEYGSPHHRAAAAVLQSYSPLHQLKADTVYPATLIITHEQDPRVGEGHSFKFTAALQAAQAGQAPILLQTIAGQGHGAESANRDVTRQRLHFLIEQLGVGRSA